MRGQNLLLCTTNPVAFCNVAMHYAPCHVMPCVCSAAVASDLTLSCQADLQFLPAVAAGSGSGDHDNAIEIAPECFHQAADPASMTDAAATASDSSTIDIQLFQLPKHIHSAASLVNGVSSKLQPVPSQSDATQDPLRLSSDLSQFRDQVEIGRGSVPHHQAHWQDEYATNWDRVGMGRNASPSDAAAAALQQVSCPSALGDESQARSGKGRSWACRLCTFATNPHHSIRCEVCDTVRGSSLQDYRPAAASSNDSLDDQNQLAKSGSAGQADHLAAGVKKQDNRRSSNTLANFLGSKSSVHANNAAVPSIDVRQGDEQAEDDTAGANNQRWLRVKFHTEVRWQCQQCKGWFQTGQKTEHEDYHLALDLQRRSHDAQPPRVGSHKRHKTCNAVH